MIVELDGPFFEELTVGQQFAGSPGMTLDHGIAAAHQGILGNRVKLSLDDDLAAAVCGTGRPVSPALVWDVGIGQSTEVTRNVMANLFYQDLAFHRWPVFGDTLRTVTTVMGLKQNSLRPDRRASGLALLRVVTRDQHDRVVLDFLRCAMLPLRNPVLATGHADDLTERARVFAAEADARPTPGWNLAVYRDRVSGPHFNDLTASAQWRVTGGDVVSSAPELARLTHNLAAVHHDRTAQAGGRLVYGGHVVGLAFSQTLRALPALVTVLRWTSCDHVGPVREQDTLHSTVTITDLHLLADGGIAEILVESRATPEGSDDSKPVLAWRFSALFA
jgi:acyl dehydratase